MARWFWGGFILLLLTGFVLMVFAVIRGAQQWAQLELEDARLTAYPLREVIRVTLAGGESLYLPPAGLPPIRDRAEDWLQVRRRRVDRELNGLLNPALDQVFVLAEARVTDFADWYYSLSGEYLRLYHAISGDLPEFLGERIEELVFQPAATATALDRLVGDMDARLARELGRSAEDYQAELTRLLREYHQDAGSAGVYIAGEWDAGREMRQFLGPLLTLSGTDLGRQGVAAGAGVAASAAVFKKLGAGTVAKTTALIAGKQSGGMLAALAAKLGLKSAAKGGGALAGAGTGAAVCTGTLVGAPLAPACALLGGVAAGAAAWILVDKAVLETDELLNREDLEQDMRESLRSQRDALRERLHAHYSEVAEQGFEQMRWVLANGQ